ncbi:MAG TPA: phosphatase PAP2 family protein [Ilumatobacter sp.]|nr:phosphatase PAP2 family protein [Ilumatobacter sp.]
MSEIDVDRTATTNDVTANDVTTNPDTDHLDTDHVAIDTPSATNHRTLDATPDAKPFWKVPPLHKPQLKALAVIWVAMTTAYVLVGLAIVQWWEPSGGGRAEARLSRWLDDQRTDQRNDLATIGSALSDTGTKIGLLVVLCPLMLWMYRRWHDWAFIAFGLLLEVSVFFTASKIVRRERPQIEQLDTAPTFSWPSGHIAACVVFYVGIATVVFWNTRSKLSRAVFAAIAVAAPIVVITCRLYLGMHYASDAIGGVVLGLLTLLVMRHQLIAARGGRPLSDPTP